MIEMQRNIFIFSVTNYFVVNLSVADLLVTTICMPVAVSQAVSIAWIHGELMCKLSSYLQGNFNDIIIQSLCFFPSIIFE